MRHQWLQGPDHEGIADERRGFLEPSVPITALAKMNNSDLDEVGAIVLVWSSQVQVVLDGRAYPGLTKKLEERSQD